MGHHIFDKGAGVGNYQQTPIFGLQGETLAEIPQDKKDLL